MRSLMRNALLACLLGLPAPAAAISILVVVDTTPIAGVSGFLAFDFVDGDGVVNNQVTIDAFGTDGLFGPSVLTGDATGDLTPGPLVLGDSTFFNEALVPVQYGTVFGFELHTTDLGGGVPAPDEFALFILDGLQGPLATSDPSGANAMLIVDLTSQTSGPIVFQAGGAQVSIFAIPEPGTMLLVSVGIAFLAARRTRRD